MDAAVLGRSRPVDLETKQSLTPAGHNLRTNWQSVGRMQVVNGYVCFNCTDVERAKKGADPADAAMNPQAGTEPKPTDLRTDQRVAEPNRPEEPRDQNRPLNFGNRGKVLNLLA